MPSFLLSEMELQLAGLDLLPFLKTGETFAVFQSERSLTGQKPDHRGNTNFAIFAGDWDGTV